MWQIFSAFKINTLRYYTLWSDTGLQMNSYMACVLMPTIYANLLVCSFYILPADEFFKKQTANVRENSHHPQHPQSQQSFFSHAKHRQIFSFNGSAMHCH